MDDRRSATCILRVINNVQRDAPGSLAYVLGLTPIMIFNRTLLEAPVGHRSAFPQFCTDIGRYCIIVRYDPRGDRCVFGVSGESMLFIPLRGNSLGSRAE